MHGRRERLHVPVPARVLGPLLRDGAARVQHAHADVAVPGKKSSRAEAEGESEIRSTLQALEDAFFFDGFVFIFPKNEPNAFVFDQKNHDVVTGCSRGGVRCVAFTIG